MENWRQVWRERLEPLLSDRELEALRAALLSEGARQHMLGEVNRALARRAAAKVS